MMGNGLRLFYVRVIIYVKTGYVNVKDNFEEEFMMSIWKKIGGADDREGGGG